VGSESSNGALKYVKQISAGAYHSVCIVDPGLIYTWGAKLTLARGKAPAAVILDKEKNSWLVTPSAMNNVINITSPPPAPSPHVLREADAVAVSSDQFDDDCQPAIPLYFQKRRVQHVVSGESFVVVKSGSELLAWGRNAQGQLGDGNKF
jgi:alpha-tubulin suppressor-like RCC1 family protein